MSKSRGNVVNPDDVLKQYGADAFRLYEMFMGPLEMVKPWTTKNVSGVYKFLGKVWRLFIDDKSDTDFEQNLTTDETNGETHLNAVALDASIQSVEPNAEQAKALHTCIKKVTEDLDGMRFNTAISAMMIFRRRGASRGKDQAPPRRCVSSCCCSNLSRPTWPRNWPPS